MRRVAVLVGALLCAALAGGCAAEEPTSAAAPSGATPAASTTAAARTTARPAPWPAYASSVRAVTAARLGASWRAGCPVAPAALRLLRVRYVGFDGRPHDGDLVLATGATAEVAAIFGELYKARFPVRLVRTVDAYGADDDASMAADNTSAFNCRAITGGTGWSIHAYGLAIDLNPRENPYVSGGTVLPPGASTDRTAPATGLVTPAVVAAFARRGWTWGGNWTGPIDYQHFQKS
jgi:hypothetical protein